MFDSGRLWNFCQAREPPAFSRCMEKHVDLPVPSSSKLIFFLHPTFPTYQPLCSSRWEKYLHVSIDFPTQALSFPSLPRFAPTLVDRASSSREGQYHESRSEKAPGACPLAADPTHTTSSLACTDLRNCKRRDPTLPPRAVNSVERSIPCAPCACFLFLPHDRTLDAHTAISDWADPHVPAAAFGGPDRFPFFHYLTASCNSSLSW